MEPILKISHFKSLLKSMARLELLAGQAAHYQYKK